MKTLLAVLMLLVGLVAGYWLNQQFAGDETEKMHISLEKAVAQSKFNLVKDNYMEFFYLCEEGKMVNNWKALMMVAYTFQYGVDAKNIGLVNKGKTADGKTRYDINIKQVEVLSSEISFMRAFTLDDAMFKNQETLISQSKDDLMNRRLFLSALRLYSSDGSEIMIQLTEGIKNTTHSLAAALGEEVVIENIHLPEKPPPIEHVGSVKYQCGDINPVFMPDKRIAEKLKF